MKTWKNGPAVMLVIAGILAVTAAQVRVTAAPGIADAKCSPGQNCSAVTWVDGPVDLAGNALPPGTVCTIAPNLVANFCVADPILTCTTSGVGIVNCNGTYVASNGLTYRCYQAINKC